MEEKELIIVGAGPIGMACAIEAKKAGLDYLVLEKGMLVDAIYHFPTNMTFFSTSELMEIGDVPFIAHSDKPTRKEALEYFRRVQDTWDLKLNFYEEVLSIEQEKGNNYTVTTPKEQYSTRFIILCTGFFGLPNKMNVPGEDLPKVKHYYNEPHPFVDQKLIVVGGANSACDVALETWQKGADVTMVVRGPELYKNVKYWILPNIKNRIKEGSIKAFFNSTIKEIREKEVVLETSEGEVALENDYVLAMTGYRPNFSFLEKVGIEFTDDPDRLPLLNPYTLESNLPNVYMAGVIVGGMLTNKYFIENSRVHAEKIVGNIKKKM